ncbi:ribonuclease H-like domain protein [Vibrio phage 1.170.O._10N.261.52.C3]|nr:ribonuclease H-like domain protein [Vibrio phage 1.170.O._10N.261.52.C3]
MIKILGIDQSLAKCAMVYTEDGIPKSHTLFKTGKASVKTKRKDTTYYDSLEQQIHHICMGLEEEIKAFKPDVIVFEALSFGSVGSASRDLACLFGAMNEVILRSGWEGEVLTIAPTSLKSFAHQFLQEEDKWDGKTKAGKPKKVKMDKKLMVEAARCLYGRNYLSRFNYSTGLDDLVDATFLARKVYEEKKNS